MNNKKCIYLFVLLLFVCILGPTLFNSKYLINTENFNNKCGGSFSLKPPKNNNVNVINQPYDNNNLNKTYIPSTNTQHTINVPKYNNSLTTYYGSTGDTIPPIQLIKELNKNDEIDTSLLKSNIVSSVIYENEKQKNSPNQYPRRNTETSRNNQTNNKSCNCICDNKPAGTLIQSPYLPRIPSYLNTQIEDNTVDDINSGFIPIPVLNSFHSFGK